MFEASNLNENEVLKIRMFFVIAFKLINACEILKRR
jgi:hypothetical protein